MAQTYSQCNPLRTNPVSSSNVNSGRFTAAEAKMHRIPYRMLSSFSIVSSDSAAQKYEVGIGWQSPSAAEKNCANDCQKEITHSKLQYTIIFLKISIQRFLDHF